MANAIAEKPQSLKDLTIEEKILATRHFRKHPMKFIEGVICPRLGIELEDVQREVLEAIFKHKKVLIPTHFAFGKSFISALAVLTIMTLSIDDEHGGECEATTLAPTFRQVQDILWKEMRAVYERVNKHDIIFDGKMTLTRYDIGVKNFAVGVSPRRASKNADTPQFIQGNHSKKIIVVGDEAGGLEDQIFEQVENITNTPGDVYIIYIGNPLTKNSRFGKMCLTDEGEGFHVVHKKAYTAPNMVANGLTSIEAIRKEAAKIRPLSRDDRKAYYDNQHYTIKNPHLLSPGWVMKCYLKWGESPLFFSKAIGEWTDKVENTLIPFDRAVECMHGTYTDENGVKRWASEERGYARYNGIKNISVGVDCSGEGTDKRTVIALEGNREIYSKSFAKTYVKSDVDFRGTQLRENGAYVAADIYNNIILPHPDRIIYIVIDVTGGFGDGVYEALMSKDLNRRMVKIIRVNFAENAGDPETYHDIIAEMAFNLADDINSEEGILLQPNDDLLNQLTDRRKTTDGKLRHMLEGKAEYKARHNGESPDEFDALMLANKARHINDSAKAAHTAIAEANAIYKAVKTATRGGNRYGGDKY